MPVLKTIRETRRINLVTDPEAWVEVYTKQTYGEYLKIQETAMGDIDPTQVDKNNKDGKMKINLAAFMAATLESMIVGWNYTDEAEVALPVNRETIRALAPEDAQFILDSIYESDAAGLPQDEKSKNLEKNS